MPYGTYRNHLPASVKISTRFRASVEVAIALVLGTLVSTFMVF